MPVVLIEKLTPQITIVTLNRPERRNALTIELLTDLVAAIKVASDEPHERILILRGTGPAFCTGLDLKAATLQNAHATAEMVAKTLITLSQTQLVTIAVRRGLVAGLVMTFLHRQVREREMRELLLGSELIDAQRAHEIGLVNRVVAPDQVMNEAQKFADSVLQGAPGAVGQTKRLIEELWWRAVKEDIDLALKYHVQARESREAWEGIAAFNEKRPPNWVR